MRAKPKVGDLVQVRGTDDPLIKVNSYGVICGTLGEDPIREVQGQKVLEVCFNPSPYPWWTKEFVTSSGGPVRHIKPEKLVYTYRKRKYPFQYFPHGVAGEGLAKIKMHKVKLWSVRLGFLGEN